MATSLNNVSLSGRLGQDPELRYTQSGDAVVSLSIAVDKAKKDSSDPSGYTTKTNWIRLSAWRETAERMSKGLTKGDHIMVTGEIDVSEYVNKEGVKQTSTQVVVGWYAKLPRAVKADDGEAAPTYNRNTLRTYSPKEQSIEPDDIPF